MGRSISQVCCRAAVIHAHYVSGAVERLIYMYVVYIHTFFNLLQMDTHEHANLIINPSLKLIKCIVCVCQVIQEY